MEQLIDLVQKELKGATAEQVSAAIEALNLKNPNANHVPAIVAHLKGGGLAVASNAAAPATTRRQKRQKNVPASMPALNDSAAIDPQAELSTAVQEIEASNKLLGFNVGSEMVAAKQRGFLLGMNTALQEGAESTAGTFSEAIARASQALL